MGSRGWRQREASSPAPLFHIDGVAGRPYGPAPMPETARYDVTLTARDLAVARGGRVIVDGVNLAVGPGDTVVLRGPNGAGKTTLLRALAGLLTPASGEITVNGDDQRIFCGVLNASKPSLTVNENLSFWTTLYGGELGAARAAFGLEPVEKRPVRELSTGYQRRLGLARLILSRRALWIVDEPTAGLDAGATTTFERLLAEHRARGGGAILATHESLEAPNARTLELRQ